MNLAQARYSLALAGSTLPLTACFTTEPPESRMDPVVDVAGATALGKGGDDAKSAGAAGTLVAAGGGGALSGAQAPPGGAPDGGIGGASDFDPAFGPAPEERAFEQLPCVAQFECPTSLPGYCPNLRCAAAGCNLWGCITEEGECGVHYAPDGGYVDGEQFSADCHPECEPSSCSQAFPGVP